MEDHECEKKGKEEMEGCDDSKTRRKEGADYTYLFRPSAAWDDIERQCMLVLVLYSLRCEWAWCIDQMRGRTHRFSE